MASRQSAELGYTGLRALKMDDLPMNKILAGLMTLIIVGTVIVVFSLGFMSLM